MGKLGISIYPERSYFEADKDYLDLAHNYGFKRIFMSLLEINGSKDEVLADFHKIIDYANSLDMDVMLDINPSLFEQLGMSYNDLSFFRELGADGVRLDLGFTGAEEAVMTHNSYDINIEINMSQGTSYLDNIMAFNPDRSHLYGSHNFYPHRYSGLEYNHFLSCTEKFNKYRLNTMAFVNSHAATFGPWPTQDGLPTLEDQRDLTVSTQVKWYKLMDNIDDLTIGNAYASEAEIKAMADVFFAEIPEIKVLPRKTATSDELTCIFNNVHFYRGDRSAYMLRSSSTREKYKDLPFPAHDCDQINRGDVLIDNVGYGQYKGELQIALKEMKNDGRVNVVGRISDDELFLINYLKPWGSFKFIKD